MPFQQRHQRIALGVYVAHGINFATFIGGGLQQQWWEDASGGDAAVDDSGPGFEAGAAQIVLQVGGFQYGG